MHFWWYVTTILLLFLIQNQIHYNPMTLQKSEVLKWSALSFTGFLLATIPLNWLAITMVKISHQETIASENAVKNLLKSLVHDISNSLSLIEIARDSIDLSAQNNQPPSSVSLNALHKGARKAKLLVTQIKEMEGLKSGRIKIKLEACDLKQLCLESIESFKKELDHKSLEVELLVPEFPVNVLTNHGILKINIFENILSNAIKFSFERHKIEVRLTKNQDHCAITVRDFGIGMSDKKLGSLFRADEIHQSIGTLGEEGSGCGLQIIKNFSEILSYQIKVTSQDTGDAMTRGTEFSILIPHTST